MLRAGSQTLTRPLRSTSYIHPRVLGFLSGRVATTC